MASFFHANKSVPIPMEFINKYMISANATYVKVYLYGLGKCYEGEADITNAQIADALDILETDVSKAWRYWKKVGLVRSEGRGVLVFDAIGSAYEKEPAEQEEVSKQPQAAQVKSNEKSMKEISKAMGINPKMKETVTLAEHLLKKTLSQREVSSIYTYIQEYSMTQEIVLVLLEYCVTIDKTNFSYIDKVAENWHEQGVDSIEEATKILNRVTKEVRMRKKCKKMFGIEREFSQTEINYIARWTSEFAMTEPMIRSAYERTVDNTGKLSMPYMNTILKSWFDKGIKSVSQIAEKEAATSRKGKDNSTGYQLDDMAAIERKLRLQKQSD